MASAPVTRSALRSRLGLLDATYSPLLVALQRSVFDATDQHVWRTARIITVDRALAGALRLGDHIVADENVVADVDALGPRQLAARVERLGWCIHSVSSCKPWDDTSL